VGGVTAILGVVALALAALAVFALFRARALAARLRAAEAREAERSEVAERTRAQKDRDHHFNTALDLLLVAGFDGAIRQLNPAWEGALGFSLAEIQSRPFLDLVHPEDREATEREMQRLRLGGAAEYENRVRTRDGTWRWLAWRAVSLPREERIYAVARDVSERRKLDEVKSDFVAVVSHELRTPLTSIRGALGLLAGGVAGEVPAPARELIEVAARNSERLVRLVNDILDVERAESGSMSFRFQLVDLSPLLAQAVEANRAYAQPFDVRFEVVATVPGARVKADPDRLLQVLANLLSNAAKYSPRGGRVDLALTRAPGRYRIAVQDYGKGIAPEFQPHIFERFAQADVSSTRQKGGTGLGLTIAKAIVERHGGRMGFATRPGEGTTFSFELPEWGAESGGFPEGGDEGGERRDRGGSGLSGPVEELPHPSFEGPGGLPGGGVAEGPGGPVERVGQPEKLP
jgi:PAS domain S-box-containing protein